MKKIKLFNLKNINVKNKKTGKLFIGTLSLLFIGVVSITFALLTSQGYFENIFHSSDYGVSIEEEFYNDWGTKKVSFVNNNASSVIIRVSYNELWSTSSEEDTLTVLNNKINGIDTVTKTWTESWLNDFVDGHDGWYYYKKVLKNTDRVQVLNEIHLNEELLNSSGELDTYKNADYELDFNFESVQADKKAVKSLWNKEITIDNDRNITWNL